MDRQLLTDDAVALVATWLARAETGETRADRSTTGPLHELIEDPDGVRFAMRFVDRVIRPDDDRVAAEQFASLVSGDPLPGFLSAIDRGLLRMGSVVAPRLPRIVMPLAKKRMRQLVGHLVVDSDPDRLEAHLARRRGQGFAQNVNLLGEAVLGEREADRRLARTADLVDQPDVDYVSVKVSAVASQLNYWDWDGSVDRIVDRLRLLFTRARKTTPRTFINLDMEEYHDLEITVAAFTTLLDEPDQLDQEAGIVLQAYLPDSFRALQQLVAWAEVRRQRGGADIKIRLVKGANLAMERVEAAMHGWTLAPYGSKSEVDANYKRCLDWVLHPDRMAAVRVGVASHNLFDVAWARLVAEERSVLDRIQFEMLQGMAPAHARAVQADSTANPLLLYTPLVAEHDFDVAISYLFRRLEENAAEGNFIRALPGLRSGSADFLRQEAAFRQSVADRGDVADGPRRQQRRPASRSIAGPEQFINEPDSDPAVASTRRWAATVVATELKPPSTTVTTDENEIDLVLERARGAIEAWSATTVTHRRDLLHATADALARRRGDLISAMVHEAGKTFAQADPEVSEAIDFARYYGDRALELHSDHARFEPLGLVAVVPPWNFPVAIPTGGTMAALAAGNVVVFKPAPETPRCAEIVAECCWEAGVPAAVLQFVRTPDDHIGRRLIEGTDGVILTGSIETADLFRAWKPDLHLFAETSGKNALIITPQADIDLAVADLVDSAFGHGGQKCSAASLGICVGDVYHSPRFRRQLVDAVESLDVGPSARLASSIGPLIGPAKGKLARGLTILDDGESWLLQPERLDDAGALWRPGVRVDVVPGGWFHQTECFGPVLGLMAAADLDEAIAIQNASPFGLTGGIHTLDPLEVDRWLERVEVGNAYVNRAITGAIVQRQPFGGWKQSSVGPGAKAGGPNYVSQLGTWSSVGSMDDDGFLRTAALSDEAWWNAEYGIDHDPSGLFCEANVFRYRPLHRVGLRIGPSASHVEVERVRMAAARCATELVVSESAIESDDDFADSLAGLGMDRVRVVGTVSDVIRRAAAATNTHLADDPVTADGRHELLHYLREQSVSRTLHRFGNLVA